MNLFTHDRLHISVEEFKGQKYIKEIWIGILTTTLFRELINESLTIYKKYLPKLKQEDEQFLLLADVSKLELISDKDIEWLTDEVNPQYEGLGFTHQAVIIPAGFFAQESVQNYEGETPKGGFDTRLFGNSKEGLSWFFQA